MKTAIVATAAIVLSAAAPIDKEILTFFGLGAIKVGAKVSTIEKTAGVRFKGAELSSADDGCRFYQDEGNGHVLIMAHAGIITRVEVLDARYRTSSGARIGDTETRVRAIYGHQLEIRPHVYDKSSRSLVVRSKDRKFALVMETDGQQVVALRAGRVPYVHHLLEGCH